MDRRDFLKKSALCIAVYGIGPIYAFAQEDARPAPKITISPKSLDDIVDARVKEYRRKGIISNDERTAWAATDYLTGEQFLSINAKLPMQSASMIKPPVVLAFLHQVKHGKLIYGPKSRRNIKNSLAWSVNKSTNWLMRRIRYDGRRGPRGIQRLLKKEYPHIFRQISIVEYIPRNERTYRNKASANDYERFLKALWKHELPYSDTIEKFMSIKKSRRIWCPEDSTLIHKTGSTAMLCGDMGIIELKGKDGKIYPYSFVGIIEKKVREKKYRRWKRERSKVLNDISRIVYEYMNEKYNIISVSSR